MKLVKQTKLFFQEGTSDKVYEIDLCEVGEGFVVNFRYGRRGASLKEGTKTIFPVDRAAAEKAFDALEQEKRRKGYFAAGEAALAPAPEKKSGPTNKQSKAIVRLLKAAAAGEEPEHWSLSRIIWRAGNLKITEAIPYIVKLADPGDPANLYATLWAIGRCGTSNTIGFLQSLDLNTQPEYIRHLHTEVLFKLLEGTERESLITASLQQVPENLRKAFISQDHDAFETGLRHYLFELKTSANEYLIHVYRLVRLNDDLHQRFLHVLADIPLRFHYFKYVRHIYKVSAMVQDYAAYGTIARSIEKQTGQRPHGWHDEEHRPLVAFSERTRSYLIRRTLRDLRKYGEVGSEQYTAFAAGMLLAFDDEQDAEAPYHQTQYIYQYDPVTRRHQSQEQRTYYDAYARYQVLNYILYQNSPRYQPGKSRWSCTPPYKPGDDVPKSREEAFPHLWDNAPEDILDLLMFTRCQGVQIFALKVWAQHPSFETYADTTAVIRLLSSPFTAVQQLGLSLAAKRYDRQSPDKLLLLAMLDCSYAEARQQAAQWVEEQRTSLLRDTAFLCDLLRLRSPEGHAWLRRVFTSIHWEQEQAMVVIGKTIAYIIEMQVRTAADAAYLTQLGDTLVLTLADQLKTLSLTVIQDLFRHTSPDVQALAGKILMRHEVKPEHLPADFLSLLLQSDHAPSRSIGLSLLGRFPDALLLQRKDQLVSFCLSPLADVRSAVRPIILRLALSHPTFGEELVHLFVPAFLIKETYEGVHDDLLSLLFTELASSLHVIPKDKVLQLVQSRFKSSQRIGNHLLRLQIPPTTLSVAEVVRLANNPQLDVRQYAWEYFNQYPDKIKADAADALQVTDAGWDDTRLFAFDYFRQQFTASEWTTDLLILLCDSTREDVEAFAREMMTRFFEAQQGTEYLLKLSQHPSAKVQLYTTSFLENYASGNITIMRSLQPYFITLLSQVNKGKTAKARVFAFLHREGLKNMEAATLASDVFTRISASMSIGEKASCIAALRDISRAYPELASPLQWKTYSDYIKA